jgi:hypothetical protein
LLMSDTPPSTALMASAKRLSQDRRQSEPFI